MGGPQGAKPNTKAPSPKVRPQGRIDNVTRQIKQTRAATKVNPGRSVRTARSAAKAASRLRGGAATTAAAIIGSDIAFRKFGDGTLKGKPTPRKQGPKDPAKNPKPIKAPTKKNSLVLAKKGGKEGLMRNGTFVPSNWSMSQKLRYQTQKKKKK